MKTLRFSEIKEPAEDHNACSAVKSGLHARLVCRQSLSSFPAHSPLPLRRKNSMPHIEGQPCIQQVCPRILKNFLVKENYYSSSRYTYLNMNIQAHTYKHWGPSLRCASGLISEEQSNTMEQLSNSPRYNLYKSQGLTVPKAPGLVYTRAGS